MRIILSSIFLFSICYSINAQKTDSKQEVNKSNLTFNRAQLLYDSGYVDDALITLDSAIALSSTNTDALYLRAVIKELKGEAIKALIDYETIKRINSEYLEAYIGSAIIYHSQNNYEQALSNLNFVINFEGIHETRAVYFKTVGYTNGPAKRNISSVTSLASMQEDMLYKRAKVYRDMEDFDRAKRDVNNLLLKNSVNPEYFTLKGLIFNSLNKIDSAKFCYQQALLIDPKNKSAAYQLHLIDPNYNLPESIFEDSEFHYAFAKKGFDAFEAGEYDKAIEYYTLAINSAPGESDYYSTRGLAYEQQKSFTEALNDFEKALSIDSYFVANYYRIANIHFRRRSFVEANQYYNIYLSYAPDDERVLYNSAMAHMQLRETNEGCSKLKLSANLGMEQATQMYLKYCKN